MSIVITVMIGVPMLNSSYKLLAPNSSLPAKIYLVIVNLILSSVSLFKLIVLK